MKVLRKIVTVALVLVLLIATTGVTLHKHYCLGRLQSVGINHSQGSCQNNQEEPKPPCCEDVEDELKVEEITKSSFDFEIGAKLYIISEIYLFAFAAKTFFIGTLHWIADYSPPDFDLTQQPRLQVFLI